MFFPFTVAIGLFLMAVSQHWGSHLVLCLFSLGCSRYIFVTVLVTCSRLFWSQSLWRNFHVAFHSSCYSLILATLIGFHFLFPVLVDIFLICQVDRGTLKNNFNGAED